MNLGQIYNLIVDENNRTGNKNAWVDVESNTIWTVGGDQELIRYYSKNKLLKDMNEEEIRELITVLNAMTEEEGEWEDTRSSGDQNSITSS